MRKLIFGTILLLLPIICFGQLVKTSVIAASGSGVSGFPQILAGTVTGETNAPAFYRHVITMPDGVQVGDLILVLFACDGAETMSIYAGSNWTIEDQGTRATDQVTGAVVWKIAEGSDQLTLLGTSTESASFMVFRLSNFETTNPLTITKADAISTNPDPPSNTGEYGAVNYLWMAFVASGADVVATVAPADFGNLSTYVWSGGTTGANISQARREYNFADAYDPGTFTMDSQAWVCFNIIINPVQ